MTQTRLPLARASKLEYQPELVIQHYRSLVFPVPFEFLKGPGLHLIEVAFINGATNTLKPLAIRLYHCLGVTTSK